MPDLLEPVRQVRQSGIVYLILDFPGQRHVWCLTVPDLVPDLARGLVRHDLALSQRVILILGGPGSAGPRKIGRPPFRGMIIVTLRDC